MRNLPESELQALLGQWLEQTEGDAAGRAAALQRFDSLYREVRRWSASFLTLLRAYPGFVRSGAPADYSQFLGRLAAFRDSTRRCLPAHSPAEVRVMASAWSAADALYRLAEHAGPCLQHRPQVMEAIGGHAEAVQAAEAELQRLASQARLALPTSCP